MVRSPNVIHDARADVIATAPAGFDARKFPIIGRHFFGLIVYPRSNDVVATDKAAA